jgi:hypothetical protein
MTEVDPGWRDSIKNIKYYDGSEIGLFGDILFIPASEVGIEAVASMYHLRQAG